MIIIENLKNENGGYSNIQTWETAAPIPKGYAVWLDTLDDADFYAYNGFVQLTIEAVDGVDTVTAYEPNIEAWKSWKAGLPEPAVPEPTVEDRVTALENAIKEGLAL